MSELRNVFNQAWLYFVGPAWGIIYETYLSGQWQASPYFWISVFWGFNYFCGSSMALLNREWDLKKNLKSYGKLGVWLMSLGVASGLQYSKVPGGWAPAGIIDCAILVTEGAYVLRNLGRMARWLGNVKQGDLLGLVADKTEEYMDRRVHTTKTTVITTETVVADICPLPHHERPEGCPARRAAAEQKQEQEDKGEF